MMWIVFVILIVWICCGQQKLKRGKRKQNNERKTKKYRLTPIVLIDLSIELFINIGRKKNKKKKKRKERKDSFIYQRWIIFLLYRNCIRNKILLSVTICSGRDIVIVWIRVAIKTFIRKWKEYWKVIFLFRFVLGLEKCIDASEIGSKNIYETWTPIFLPRVVEFFFAFFANVDSSKTLIPIVSVCLFVCLLVSPFPLNLLVCLLYLHIFHTNKFLITKLHASHPFLFFPGWKLLFGMYRTKESTDN